MDTLQKLKTNINSFSFSSSFIGREADLTSLHTLLASHRLITMLGAPGIGKTRLSLEYARRQLLPDAQAPTGGVWFCDLTEAKTPDDICTVLGKVLQVSFATENTATGLAEQLANILIARGPNLLIMDNFEQIASYAKETLGVWLEKVPDTRFLVTSRASLSLPGEVLFDLFPLSLPKETKAVLTSEAGQLFVACGQEVQRTFTVTKQNAQTVVQLLQQLDGIPLAIELAATRLRVFTPEQILARLAQRFRLLAKVPTPLPERRGTLYSVIDFSWALLSPYEQEAFAQCSVFRGGFSVEAAQEVLDLSAYPEANWIPDILQSLCDKSLLFTYEPEECPGTRRFSLYLSIREYSASRLEESGSKIATEARHIQYFLYSSKEWREWQRNWERIEAMPRLLVEMENLLAAYHRALEASTSTRIEEALLLAISLSDFLLLRGLYGLRFSLLDTALNAGTPEEIAPKLRALALRKRGQTLRLLGRTAQSFQDLEEARLLAEELEDQELLARVSSDLGIVLFSKKRLAEAKTHQEKALALSCELGNRYLEGLVRNRLGVILLEQGYPEDAKKFYHQALDLHQQEGNPLDEGSSLANLAAVYMEQGNLERAQEYSQRALRIIRELKNRHTEGILLVNLANIEQEKGNIKEAKSYLREGLQISQAAGHRELEGVCTWSLGNCYQEENDQAQARQCYEKALTIYQEKRFVGLVLSYLGALEALEGDLIHSKTLFQRAKEKLRGCESPFYQAIFELCRGHLELASAQATQTKNPAKSKIHMQTVQKILSDPKSNDLAARSIEARLIHRHLGRVFEEEKRLSKDVNTILVHSATNDTSSPHASPFPKEALVVSFDGKWFRPPHGERVNLHRRKSLRLLLCALVEQRVQRPGIAIELSQLLEYGWPREIVHPDVRNNRVYLAIARLRKLGLQKFLLRRDDGYMLDPNIQMLRAKNA